MERRWPSSRAAEPRAGCRQQPPASACHDPEAPQQRPSVMPSPASPQPWHGRADGGHKACREASPSSALSCQPPPEPPTFPHVPPGRKAELQPRDGGLAGLHPAFLRQLRLKMLNASPQAAAKMHPSLCALPLPWEEDAAPRGVLQRGHWHCSGATSTAAGPPALRQGLPGGSGAHHAFCRRQLGAAVPEEALPSRLPWHFPSVHRRMSG